MLFYALASLRAGTQFSQTVYFVLVKRLIAMELLTDCLKCFLRLHSISNGRFCFLICDLHHLVCCCCLRRCGACLCFRLSKLISQLLCIPCNVSSILRSFTCCL